MPFLRLPAVLLSVLASLLIAGSAVAADLPALVGSLTTGSFGDRETAVGALATSGDARAAPILEALAAGQLYVRQSDNLVLIGEIQGNGQFDTVWQTSGLLVANEWSPYLPDSKDLIADWRKPMNCGNFNVVTGKCGGKGK